MRFIVGGLLLLLFNFSIAQDLPGSLEKILSQHKVNKEDLSLIIEPVDGAPIASLNADVSRSPASVTKLFTTAAGLIQLGPDYRWKTKFYADQPPNAEGVVEGNLYVKGGGDPFLVEEYLLAMLNDLKLRGVHQITGDIVLDHSMYKLTEDQKNRVAFDGHPWSAYNAVPAPLMVNFRTVTFNIEPINHKKIKITTHPDILNWKIDNQLDINNGRCANSTTDFNIERDEKGYATVTVNGRYSMRCGKESVTAVMGNPDEQFYYLFRMLAQETGIDIEGAGRVAKIPKSAKLIYEGETKPLSEQIQIINRLSNNVMARQLFLTLGVEKYGEPGSLKNGQRAVEKILDTFGLDTRPLQIKNGSGLSRDTRITADALAELLKKMAASQYREIFKSSLSVAGHNGTLKRRYRGGVLDAHVFGKTGTMKQVRSLAAYVQAKNGKTYIVVMIGNGKTALRTRRAQDDVLRWVYLQ